MKGKTEFLTIQICSRKFLIKKFGIFKSFRSCCRKLLCESHCSKYAFLFHIENIFFKKYFCLIHEKNVIHVVDTHESLVCELNKFSKKICWTFFVGFCWSFLVQKTRGRNVGLETRNANQFICKFDLFLSFFIFFVCLFVMETFVYGVTRFRTR